MNPLEQELKNALRRQEPSTDFTERVMARIQSAGVGRRIETLGWSRAAGLRNWFHVPAVRWASAAAMCFVLVIGGLAQYRARERRRRQEGEMARAQVMLALRIASAKLNGALREVKQVNEAPHDETR